MTIKGRLLSSIAIIKLFRPKRPPVWQAPLPVNISQPYVLLENHSGGTTTRKNLDDIFIRFDTIPSCDGQKRDDSNSGVAWVKAVNDYARGDYVFSLLIEQPSWTDMPVREGNRFTWRHMIDSCAWYSEIMYAWPDALYHSQKTKHTSRLKQCFIERLLVWHSTTTMEFIPPPTPLMSQNSQ